MRNLCKVNFKIMTQPNRPKVQWWKVLNVLLSFSLITLLAVGGGFVLWASNALGPLPEVANVLVSTQSVRYQDDGFIVYEPLDTPPTAGLIIYPGGKVNPLSYAVTARAIATQGYLVAIVRPPLNMALFDSNAAQAVINTYPHITQWAVAGHSLGGVAAVKFADTHADSIGGIALWASYPAEGDRLDDQNLSAVLVTASNDKLFAEDAAIYEKLLAKIKEVLPADTMYVDIAGGNHAGFGWYGEQPRDGKATISLQEQTDQIVAATLAMLKKMPTK